MTHPEYRKRGLSKRLMNKVLEEYENKYDFMFLFANHNVLDFYPKFGSKSINEYQFSMKFEADKKEKIDLCKLDVFDIVSKKEVHINKILSMISNQNTNQIVFHYTPDYRDINTQEDILNGDDVLFVKTNGNNEFSSQTKHPISSINNFVNYCS